MSQDPNSPRWFEQSPAPLQAEPRTQPAKKDLWVRCPGCDQILFRAALAELMAVCPGSRLWGDDAEARIGRVEHAEQGL